MTKQVLKYAKFLVPALLVIIAGAIFYIYESSKHNLDLSFDSPNDILLGVPFDFKVNFSNQSGETLNDVNLTVNLPDGAAFVGSDQNKLILVKNLGNIGEGSLISETYRIVFLRGQDTTQKINATVSYGSAALGAHFENNNGKDLAIHGPGVAIDITGPDKVLNGQDFDLALAYRNVSDNTDFSGLQLKMEYPANFTFASATLAPDQGKDTWNLGDLHKGSEGNFSIHGSLIGPGDSAVQFQPHLTMELEGQTYELEIKPFGLTIAQSPLALSIVLNDQPNYTAKLNDNLNYAVSYTNNSGVDLRNVTIKVQLIGSLFDFGSLASNAIFDEANDVLIWNPQNSPDLNLVASKSAGVVKFSLRTKSSYPISGFGDKNFTLKADAQIESPTALDSASGKTSNIADLETKISGNIIVDARSYFRDAASGILNQGPLPLKVGQPTDFTVHWVLKNFASDISGIELRAPLLSGVKFTGAAKTNFGQTPFYDSVNNQMVWQIDKLAANQGVVDDPIEAIFQVEATPGSGQVGNYLPLLGATQLKAHDDFADSDVTASGPMVTTALTNDPTANSQSGVVQP